MRVYLALTSEILRSDGVSESRAVVDKRARVNKESRLVNFIAFISLFIVPQKPVYSLVLLFSDSILLNSLSALLWTLACLQTLPSAAIYLTKFIPFISVAINSLLKSLSFYF